MCDTVVATSSATGDGACWLGKNSDREPGEAQFVEVHGPDVASSVACTYRRVEVTAAGRAMILSRPFWMWGAEMGVNDAGVAIANEAVFTRVPVESSGLTGMDLVRLTLREATSAEHALDVLVGYLERVGQGGNCGFRGRLGYHNTFVIADGRGAWIVDTAGRHWAAERVDGVRTVSNVLSVGAGADRVSVNAENVARREGWYAPSDGPFDFAAAFADPAYRELTGGELRSACTYRRLAAESGSIGWSAVANTLRDHGGQDPGAGWRMQSPCAHASWLPTRHAGQTTGSMIARLEEDGEPRAWLTGTSAPCLSVFKPVPIDGADVDLGPAPGARFDARSLFWAQERLHRAVLPRYKRRRSLFEKDRVAFEQFARGTNPADHAAVEAVWAEHRDRVDGWLSEVHVDGGLAPPLRPRDWYWLLQSARDAIP